MYDKNIKYVKEILIAASAVIMLISLKAAIWGNIFECPFHYLTGLYCPGCGGMRSIGYLVSGNIYAAMKSNVIVTVFNITSPLLLLFMIRYIKSRIFISILNTKCLLFTLVIMLIFSVIRNIPYYPFFNLRP